MGSLSSDGSVMDNEPPVMTPRGELEKKFQEINEILKSQPLKAVKKFDELVRFTNFHYLPSEKAFQAAKKLAESIEKASFYKNRKLDSSITQVQILGKVLLAREFRTQLSETFSLQSALSLISGNKYHVMKSGNACQPFASGVNRNGRLGVGVSEDLQKLKAIELPKGELIFEIYMGKHHTIFLTENGDFYGAGSAKNFMVDGSMGEIEDIQTPVKLDYVKIPKDLLSQFKAHCTVTDQSTIFHGYNERVELMVGKAGDKEAISKGANWQTQANSTRLPRDLEKTKVELMSVVTKKMETYTVDTNGLWWTVGRGEKVKQEIVFFVCGRRASRAKLAISFCTDGTCYAINSGKLYKGKLVTGLQKADSDRLEDDQGDEESIVVFMKEVVVPFEVEGFYASENNESIIFYPTTAISCPRPTASIDDVKKITSPLAPRIFEMRFPDEIAQISASTLREQFSKHLENWPENFAEKLYSRLNRQFTDSDYHNRFWTGLPMSGINYVRQLRILQDFLRIDKDQVPVVLKTLDQKEDPFDFMKGLKAALSHSQWRAAQMKPFLEKSLEPKERSKNLSEKARNYLAEVSSDTLESLRALEKLPLKYRRLQRDTIFQHFVKFLIDQLIQCTDQRRPAVNFKMTLMRWGMKLDQVYADRVKFGDIDKEDPKLQPIRVECIPVNYQFDNEGYVTLMDIDFMCTNVPAFYIRLIDPRLMEFVEDGILSLNYACNQGKVDFFTCLDAFFAKDDICPCIHTHKKNPAIDNTKICEGLPAEEKYTVSTSDGKQVEVPALLFQLYAGAFDAGRRRAAESSGKPVNELSVTFPARTVEALVETLLDPRSFFSFENDMKESVFKFAHELMIKHLEVDLIRMIIMTATEESCQFFQWLFTIFPRTMAEEIGRLGRADILLFWDQLPFDHSNLSILNDITGYFFKHCYNATRADRLPVTLLPDEQVDDVDLDESWLFEHLCIEQEDKDIRWMLTNSMWLWSGYERKAPKRNRERRPVDLTRETPIYIPGRVKTRNS